MKRFFLTSVAMMVAASPAMAMKVTNLDKVVHTVELVASGGTERHVIQPDATEIFSGATQGTISLVSAQNPKKSKSAVNSDGLLSGYIGNGRTEGIPTDPEYNYVIWPGGKLTIQSHTRISGRR